MSKSLLTPKELADAIGASESALRRWVDAGQIRMSRTAGGHRRIPIQEAIRFIRESGSIVVRPEMLGLRELPAAGEQKQSADDDLFNALHAGNRAVARGLIVSAYLAGSGLAALFDGPVRSAMNKIGELWRHASRGIMIEHRATEICIQTLAELRGLIPVVDDCAPLAVGGAPQGDLYILPSMMAAAVLAEAGLRDVNFGAGTPVELLAEEAIAREARLVWLSISAEQDIKPLRSGIKKLDAALAKRRVSLVIGGRFAADCIPRGATHARLANSMTELAALAQRIKPAKPVA